MDHENHVMTLEATSGAEQLWVCPEEECGRKVVFKGAGEMVVLDRGDFSALHSGGGIAVNGTSILQ